MKKNDVENLVVFFKKYILPFVLIFIILYGSYKIIFTYNEININNVTVDISNVPNEWSEDNWVKELTIAIDVEKLGNKITQYSFDNGNTWQTSNIYKVISSGTVEIKLKDSNEIISDTINYNIVNVDGVEPSLEVVLPTQIEQYSSIDLATYITASDNDSGIKGDVIITPSIIDTSVLGTKTINICVSDNAGNTTSRTVMINVVQTLAYVTTTSNNNVYYRYRTKTINSYSCGTYDCSYVDYNKTTESIKKFASASYCCLDNNCMKENQIIKQPCLAGDTCSSTYVNKYKVDESTCYDSSYITDVSGTIKTSCDADEILIDGYCHTIDSIGEISCQTNYALENNTCYYKVNKTCNKTCSSTVWSSWTEWSTKKQTSSSNIQEQKKQL